MSRRCADVTENDRIEDNMHSTQSALPVPSPAPLVLPLPAL